ncbi:hypothetical protein NM04_08690 [Massilia aurea]|uniref:Uncharacterized protein n=1 Tax=Massilia aurea TaxID=373040 RepID=A0A422QN18_9BURK|nr:hypothetical protein NM04_08690 [Massilia aurea]
MPIKTFPKGSGIPDSLLVFIKRLTKITACTKVLKNQPTFRLHRYALRHCKIVHVTQRYQTQTLVLQ